MFSGCYIVMKYFPDVAPAVPGRGVDPCRTGGTCFPIFMMGTSMVMSPQYFRSLLYLNANTTCSFTRKASSPDPLPEDPSLLLCPPNNPAISTPLVPGQLPPPLFDSLGYTTGIVLYFLLLQRYFILFFTCHSALYL